MAGEGRDAVCQPVFAVSGRCRLQENKVCEVLKGAEQFPEVNPEPGEVLKMADC